MKKKLSYLAFALVLGAALIWVWASYIDPREVLSQIVLADRAKLLLAALFYLVAYFIRSLRFNFLIRSNNRISIFRTWQYSLAGNLVNYLVPIRLGEFAKAWFIKRNHGEPITRSLPTIFIDKSFDTLGILVVMLIIPFIAIKISQAIISLIVLLFAFFVLSLGLIIFSSVKHKGLEAVIQGAFFFCPRRYQTKIRSYISFFIQGLNLFEHRWSYLFYAVILTVLGIICDAMYFTFVFRSLGNLLPFAVILFGYTMINLTYALPQPPAQLGSNEWMMMIIFSAGFGLTRNSAGAIMALAHLLTALIIIVTGSLAIANSGYDIIKKVFKGEDDE
ncbi:MAG: lysylphosphatidylglycerol synthase transmembrane domain-containing protein [Candidatus Cloacimonetes bacterium]|nr:lysylphosphatidylglycerol synthase transmembrane domain-containing protein [Candidatus Cloacimonadota bacterium]